MKIETRIFLYIAAFLFVAGGVYWWWTGAEGDTEVAGATALVLSGGFLLIIGGYCAFVARRIDPRPEDRHEAEIAEGAGELGFFSPGSYWPFGLGLAAFVGGIALAYFEIWLIVLAVVAVLTAAGGLLFEYYTGQNESMESTEQTDLTAP